jgi:capsular polysaccharide export protein
MKTLLFAVNSKHRKFFNKIKDNSKCNVDIIYTKRLWFPCFKAIKYIKKVDFSKPVELKITDFYAKRDSIIPKFFIKTFFIFLAYFNYFRYFKHITSKYNQIMLWNGITFRQAIAIQIAKLYDIKPVYIENGLMPNRIVIDKKGVNFFNSVPREKEFFENYKNESPLPESLIPRQPKNAKKFANIKKEPLPEKFIFIPFQVDYDTQIMLYSPWIKNMRHLFSIVEEVSKKTDITFVFKEHPSSQKNYPDLHKKCNSKIVFANGYPTQELIQKSSAVITINSTVGIESLLFNKKVIVLGNAFYAINKITKKIENENSLIDTINNLDNWLLNNNLINNFLKYLYYEYLIEGNFLDYSEKQIAQIERILSC